MSSASAIILSLPAGAIVYLSSHASDYVTGTHILLDGGGTARAMAQ